MRNVVALVLAALVFAGIANQMVNRPASSAASANPAAVLVGLVVLAAYFAPSIVAARRSVANPAPIYVVNLFLGWTFVGWVVALAMAVGARAAK